MGSAASTGSQAVADGGADQLEKSASGEGDSGAPCTVCHDEARAAPPYLPWTSSTPAAFPQSVMSGNPTESSVALWTRCVPPLAKGEQDQQGQQVKLSVAVYRDAGLTDEVWRRDGLVVTSESDWTVRVDVPDLSAGTFYFYVFTATSGEGQGDGEAWSARSNVGRTKTAPSADADTEVRVAVVNCQDSDGRYYNGYLSLFRQWPSPDASSAAADQQPEMVVDIDAIDT